MDVEKDTGIKSFNSIWTILFVVGSVLLFFGITNNTLWYDESFFGVVVRHSYLDLIRIAAGDNHPPFYFILSKVLTDIMGNNVFSLRLASLLGVIALAALGYGPVRRIWGEKASLLFTLLVFATPAFMAQALNARMYTWAAFFCTASTLYAYCALAENKRRDWIVFGLFSVLGLYTHVYLMLECCAIYALAFLWVIIRDRKKLATFIIVSVSVLALYLPWIFVVIQQAADVAKEFWIPLPTVNWVLTGLLFMPFQHEFGSSLHFGLLCAAFVLATALFIIGILNALKNKNSAGRLFLWSMTIAILTIVGATIITYQFKPILFGRYLTSLLGLYILVWVYGILFFRNSIATIISVCLLIAVFFPQILEIKMVSRNGPMVSIKDYIDSKAGSDDVFVHNDEHSFGIFCYYFPQYKHYLNLKDGFEGYSNYSAFAPAGRAGHNYSDFVKGHNRVWLINRNTSVFSKFPFISYYEFEKKGKLYKSAPEKRFSQKNSFLDLDIAEFSSDSVNKFNEDKLFSGTIKEVRILVDGFRNNQGMANIMIFNRELYELSDKYLWQNKDISQISTKVAEKLISNNSFLSDEEKSFMLSFYTLDKNTDVYNLSKSFTKEDYEKLYSIIQKMDHTSESAIVNGKAQFKFNGLPKDKYYIVVYHDENSNHQLDMKENAIPAEGTANSGTEGRLQQYPTFTSNNIALNQDDMETKMHIYYY
ncbi:MAG: DUF2141 domain-containing protein [Fibrobacter sp.]|nr:DUF2141 domain-containing protein [Fibrobacter sp.]